MRSPIHHDLRQPKYAPRVVEDKKLANIRRRAAISAEHRKHIKVTLAHTSADNPEGN